MPEQRNLKLIKPWGGHPIGTQLAVLGPGENPAPGTVDAARAATLINHQLAVDAIAAKPARPNRKEA